MKKQTLIFSLALLAGTTLSGCTHDVLSGEVADRIASPAFMIEREIPAGPFALTAYERMHKRHAPADIYIEGDGKAWLSKRQASRDPTPINPVALHLASMDKAQNVAWLARPCQYSGTLDENTACAPDYWKGKRFAPEVIDAYNEALDEIKARYDIEAFNLIGFSGGGAVAAILAAQREDVLTLRTVAGNLDHRAHSALHEVSYLQESLNPPDFAARLSAMPQIHYVGGQDEIMPPAVLQSYLQAVGQSGCVHYQIIQEAAHDRGWVEKWPSLLAKVPRCEGAIALPAYDYAPMPEPFYTAPERPEKP